MQDFEGVYNSAAGLYSLAFLLTSRSDLSLALTLEVLDSEDDSDFFSSRRLPQLRRRIMEKALALMREELAASSRQTASLPLTAVCLPPSTWSLAPHTSKLEIERALLAIEIFPRSALLLTVFEGLNLEEASALLGRDRDSVLQGRMAGLWDFTRHLARMQGWNPSVAPLPPASFESEASSLSSEL